MKSINRLLKLNLMQNLQKKVSFINSTTAKALDDELMGSEINYTLEQLMEIAGQSVAFSIHDAISNKFLEAKKILNISGPGSKIFK